MSVQSVLDLESRASEEDESWAQRTSRPKELDSGRGEVCSVGASGADDRIIEPVEQLARMASICGRVRVDDLSIGECVAAVERIASIQMRLAGLKSATLARIGQLQRPSSVGSDEPPVPLGTVKLPGEHRTVFDLIEKSGGQSRKTSRKELQRAEAVGGQYPLFGQAVRQGQVSPEHIDVLNRFVRDVDVKEKASADETRLLDRARRESVTQFQQTVRTWLVTHAPVAAERKAQKEARQEQVSLYPEGEGFMLRGWLTGAHGLLLDRVLRNVVGVPSKEDTRTPSQRTAQALVDLARSKASYADEGRGTRDSRGASSSRAATSPFQISVHVPLETLVQTEKAIEKGCRSLEALDRRVIAPSRGNEDAGNHMVEASCVETGRGLGLHGGCLDSRPSITAQLGHVLATIRSGLDVAMLEGFPAATLENGNPLVPTKLAELLCESNLARIVLSARGEPLDASHAQRAFSITQSRAIRTRDRNCRFPGCDRGVEMSQIHHAQQWAENGKTVVDNAVLLCFHHHEVVHRDEITIAHHSGGFAFYRPSGKLVGVRLHESRSRQ